MNDLDQTCVDCKTNKVFTSEDDLQWWKDRINKTKKQGTDMTLPKRCKECRAKKKMQNQQRSGY